MSGDNGAITPALLPPETGVTVRMYNVGFGDCLLLAFRAGDGTARYMLVDCGVHHTYPGGSERMKLVARDIAGATGGHLHVVVVTHEHTDHLYGWKYARDILDPIPIDQVWMPWTEDPQDPAARRLKDMLGPRIRALAAAVQQLGAVNSAMAARLQAVLDFEPPEWLGATGGKADQIKYLAGRTRPVYCRPGAPPLTVSGVDGVKVYVLGPPRDEAAIKKLEAEDEMYPQHVPVGEEAGFVAAVLGAAGDRDARSGDQALARLSRPFDERFEISPDAARLSPAYAPFFRSFYGFGPEDGEGPEWRRIDTAWLAAADQLAIDINTYTNNSSLALAVELPGAAPRPVLLLAADAQVGNWLSWGSLAWPGEGPGGQAVTGDDLIARTVVYKVGHHGSRNATPSRRGLERMLSPDLVALLPVDANWAAKQDWEHPARSVYDSLERRTRGRILRTDQIPPRDEPLTVPDPLSQAEWQVYLGRRAWDPGPDRLWIQYTFP